MKKRSYHFIALIFPLLFIATGLYLLNTIPVKNIVFPASAENILTIEELHRTGETHIEITLPRLYTAGISHTTLPGDNRTIYYAIESGRCMFFLLNQEDDMADVYESATIKGTLFEDEALADELAAILAEDLDWNTNALNTMISPVIAGETKSNYYGFLFFLAVFLIGSLISIYHFIKNIYKFLTFSQESQILS